MSVVSFEDLDDWEVNTGCHQNRTSVPQLIVTSVFFSCLACIISHAMYTWEFLIIIIFRLDIHGATVRMHVCMFKKNLLHTVYVLTHLEQTEVLSVVLVGCISFQM